MSEGSGDYEPIVDMKVIQRVFRKKDSSNPEEVHYHTHDIRFRRAGSKKWIVIPITVEEITEEESLVTR